jgi:histidinol phosphatase-like enzyme
MKQKIYAFDLDDTLCSRHPDYEHLGKEKYKYCYPIQPMIDILNEQYDKGHKIIIYTARGMSIYNGNVHDIYNNLYEQTISDLKKWGIQHHGLVMGKLHYDLLIDDKCCELENIKIKLI